MYSFIDENYVMVGDNFIFERNDNKFTKPIIEKMLGYRRINEEKNFIIEDY